MFVGNVNDELKLREAVKSCDIVFNFAAISDLNEAIENPIQTVEINVLGNLKILEACRLEKIRRYIYASTIYVNSREGGFYRCSKQAAETYIEEYQRLYGLDYTILRYGSLYGPRSDHRNGLWRIVNHALETGRLKYHGSAETMREYIHVEDAAIASITSLGEEFLNQHVVLTGQEPMRVLDLLKTLAEILGLPEQSIDFTEGEYSGHYVRTPYAYQPKLGRKYIPPLHVDLGQGLVQLIEEIKSNSM